jgi:hypothetical protein
MADMAGLMGAEVIVSGLQDAVIETLVELGMTLPNIQAVLDLDDALALSREDQQAGEFIETGSATNNLSLSDTYSEGSPFADLTEV